MIEAELFERIFQGVLQPLVLGGELVPGRPIGVDQAHALAQTAAHVTAADDPTFLRGRLQTLRPITPVDHLPRLGGAEWMLAAALHNLIQSSNHELSGVLTRGRHETVLTSCRAIVDATPPVQSVSDALARHSVLARIPELVRVDTQVSWWTGSQRFIGQPPSKRLTAWPKVRSVSTEKTRVPLHEFPSYSAHINDADFLSMLDRLLARTPITDFTWLALSGRPWSVTADHLVLIRDPAGRRYAARALQRSIVQADGPAWRTKGTRATAAIDAIKRGAVQITAPIQTPDEAIAPRMARSLLDQLAADAIALGELDADVGRTPPPKPADGARS